MPSFSFISPRSNVAFFAANDLTCPRVSFYCRKDIFFLHVQVFLDIWHAGHELAKREARQWPHRVLIW